MVGEGFGLTGLVVGLPLQLDKHCRRLLQVLVSVLRGLEDDGELTAENKRPWEPFTSNDTRTRPLCLTIVFLLDTRFI